jgi:acyl-coenzyme A synthetase/AMP-(fatty) acid ligase
MLKPSGVWVSPAEVEARLLAHEAVAQAAVVAARDGDGPERLVAFVILLPGQAVTEAELIEFCRQGLPSVKRPRKVAFTGAFPTTATGKVRRWSSATWPPRCSSPRGQPAEAVPDEG